MSRVILRPWQIHAFGATVCAALTVGAYFGIGRPITAKYTSLNSIRAQWDVHRRRSAELDGKRRVLRSRLNAAHAALAASSVRLSSADLLNTRMAAISNLAADCRLVLHETSSGQLQNAGTYETIRISLSGSGSYPDTATFLNRLREQMPDTGVVSMKLTGNPRAPEATAQYQLELLWYTAPVIATAGE